MLDNDVELCDLVTLEDADRRFDRADESANNLICSSVIIFSFCCVDACEQQKEVRDFTSDKQGSEHVEDQHEPCLVLLLFYQEEVDVVK